MGSWPRILAAALWAGAPLLPLKAQVPEAEAPGELRLYEENDFFNPFTAATDRYYTQGLRLEWLAPSRRADSNFLPGISHADWCRFLCGKNVRGGAVNTGYALGQNIYTPANIAVAAPQPYDRPWAGLLYVSRIARVSYAEPRLRAKRQDRIELSLGIVGPASLAKETQTEWHRLIGVGLPRGWANQLRNEPVLQLRYETALRWPEHSGGHADIIPRLRGNLGNALTSLEAEVTGRIGWNLAGFGVDRIPFSTPLAAAAPQELWDAVKAIDLPRRPRRPAKWFASGDVFARAGLKLVAHSIFLDGNSFTRNDIRIDRKPLVPEIAVGAELNLVDRLWISGQFVHRGSEFQSWRGRDAPAQEFGAITIAWAIAR